MAELDEKLTKALAQKEKVENQISKLKNEIDEVLLVIKTVCTQTLKLE